MAKKKIVRKKTASKKKVKKEKPGRKKGTKNTKLPAVKTKEEREAEKPCTAEEEKFCEVYIQHFSALEAWRELGKPEKNSNQACKAGYDYKHRPRVKRRITELMDIIRGDREEIILQLTRELRRIAFFDSIKLYDEDGNFKNIDKMDEDTRAVIQRIERTNIGGIITVKYWLEKKDSAIDKLIKVLGIGSETLNVKIDTLKSFLDSMNDKSRPPGLEK